MYDYFDPEFNSEYASDFIVEYNYKTKTWDKFQEDRINNYVDVPKETITNLASNEGPLLQWFSPFHHEHVYDTVKDEFISLKKEDTDLLVYIYGKK